MVANKDKQSGFQQPVNNHLANGRDEKFKF